MHWKMSQFTSAVPPYINLGCVLRARKDTSPLCYSRNCGIEKVSKNALFEATHRSQERFREHFPTSTRRASDLNQSGDLRFPRVIAPAPRVVKSEPRFERFVYSSSHTARFFWGPQKPIVQEILGSQGAPTTDKSPQIFPGFRPHAPHVKNLPGGPPPPSN